MIVKAVKHSGLRELSKMGWQTRLYYDSAIGNVLKGQTSSVLFHFHVLQNIQDDSVVTHQLQDLYFLLANLLLSRSMMRSWEQYCPISACSWLLCVTLGTQMFKYKELYDLDPSLYLDIAVSDEDGLYVQSQKLFAAVRNDRFYARLHQLAWEEYKEQKRYKEFSSDIIIIHSTT